MFLLNLNEDQKFKGALYILQRMSKSSHLVYSIYIPEANENKIQS